MEDYKKYEPVFGSWEITRSIGKGSFGKVFEISREEFGTKYRAALKIISVPQDEDDIKTRMSEGTSMDTVSEYYEGILKEIINENEIMSQLKGNSNIVSYEDHQIIRHDDGIGYDILIRMELLTPLLDRMIERKLSEKDVVRLGIDICKALELCHKKNIIHRDIKPQNIFISENGDYKLGDFGIARTMEKTTGGMSRKGTYKYMAPEVFRGEEYDSTADIYSLGIVLFSLLNGNRGPFLPPPPAKITHNNEEEAWNRRFSGEEIPSPAYAGKMLSFIIKKACAADRFNRYETAEQMRRDLESYYENYEFFGEGYEGAYDGEETVFDSGMQSGVTGSVYAGNTGSYAATGKSGAPTPRDIPPGPKPGPPRPPKIWIILASVLVGIIILAIGIGGFKALTGGNGNNGEGFSGENMPTTAESTGVKLVSDVQDVEIRNFDWDWDSNEYDSTTQMFTVDTIFWIKNNSDKPIVGIQYEATAPNDKPIKNENKDAKPLAAFGYIDSESSGPMVGVVHNTKKSIIPDKREKIIIKGVYVNEDIGDYVVPKGSVIDHKGEDYTVALPNKNDSDVDENSKLVIIAMEDGKIVDSDATGKLNGAIPPHTDRYVVDDAFKDPHFNQTAIESMEVYAIDKKYLGVSGKQYE